MYDSELSVVSAELEFLSPSVLNIKIQEGIYFLKGGFQGRKKKTVQLHGWVVKKYKARMPVLLTQEH